MSGARAASRTLETTLRGIGTLLFAIQLTVIGAVFESPLALVFSIIVGAVGIGVVAMS